MRQRLAEYVLGDGQDLTRRFALVVRQRLDALQRDQSRGVDQLAADCPTEEANDARRVVDDAAPIPTARVERERAELEELQRPELVGVHAAEMLHQEAHAYARVRE